MIKNKKKKLTKLTRLTRLIIIDANSIIHRAFYALPPLINKKKEPTGAVYGFLLAFFRAIKDFRPDFIAACFDVHAPTFRHKKFKQYKAKRPPAPKELYSQIPKIKEVLTVFKVPFFEKEGFEADDIIGTIAKLAPRKQAMPELEIIILSGDKDALQLVNKKTKVFVLNKGVKNAVLYDSKQVKEKYNINPDQVLDFKALRGDPSDNIPGITGIGEKTAVKLLNQFNTLDNLYQELEENSEKAKELQFKLKELLLQYKEQAFLSRFLAEINRDTPIDFDLKKCQWGKYKESEVVEVLQNLGFNSLVKRLPELKNKKHSSGKDEKDQPVRKNLSLW